MTTWDTRELNEVLGKLLKLAEKEDVAWVTPAQLLGKVKKYGVVSKRDLAIGLSKFGLHTRVASRHGKNARYYVLNHKELVKILQQIQRI